jgi:hypothetical protein
MEAGGLGGLVLTGKARRFSARRAPLQLGLAGAGWWWEVVGSLLDLFTPLLDLGRGSLARLILRMARRVGVGDMVSAETLGQLCWPRRG